MKEVRRWGGDWACGELLWEPRHRSEADFRQAPGVVWEWPAWGAQKVPMIAITWGMGMRNQNPREAASLLNAVTVLWQHGLARHSGPSPEAPKRTKDGDGVPGPKSYMHVNAYEPRESSLEV